MRIIHYRYRTHLGRGSDVTFGNNVPLCDAVHRRKVTIAVNPRLLVPYDLDLSAYAKRKQRDLDSLLFSSNDITSYLACMSYVDITDGRKQLVCNPNNPRGLANVLAEEYVEWTKANTPKRHE